MRKSSKLFAILSTAMFVTALGTAPCYAEEVTINFWHHYSEQSAENETLNNVLIPEFEKENPDIKVNAVSHEWSDLHEKILISAKSETLPDVARLDSAWVPEFEKMGILGQKAGILGNSITEMKARECAYLHNANSIILLIL